ncbi:MAG: hypothetical protein WD649_00525 [Thermoleophilaceae bacterium]
MSVGPGTSIVEIPWHINPFRAEQFEAAWREPAETVLDYGASAWALLHNKDDPLQFIQLAAFPDKVAFDRYWQSEEIAAARAAASGLYQVPILPVWHELLGGGIVSAAAVEPA